jgi:hypothetical protein
MKLRRIVRIEPMKTNVTKPKATKTKAANTKATALFPAESDNTKMARKCLKVVRNICRLV